MERACTRDKERGRDHSKRSSRRPDIDLLRVVGGDAIGVRKVVKAKIVGEAVDWHVLLL